jgi:pimeloyl-ACP methyl ester carboxylesterase
VARRILIVVVVAALVAGCGGHQPTHASVKAANAPRAAAVGVAGGHLVDLGGGRLLHLNCAGSGSPTVVLEAGFPGDSTVWGDVQPQLAETTRACAYDRAGLGNSPAIPGVPDAGDGIADLQRLLHVAHLQPPYVLVGHSYGGMLVRLFAREHRRETAGVVLVDARGRDATRRQLAIWPEREAPAIRRAVFRPVQRGVDLATSEALVRRVRNLGDTPLAVITAARHREWARVGTPQLAQALDRLWSTMQDELAALSTDHVHVVAVRSDHFVQRRADGQPDVVIRAVGAVVRAARTHARLPRCQRLFGASRVRCRQ